MIVIVKNFNETWVLGKVLNPQINCQRVVVVKRAILIP